VEPHPWSLLHLDSLTSNPVVLLSLSLLDPAERKGKRERERVRREE
jgi:hypothetical protein